MKIGFIGPGRMGRPMAGRLVAAGHDVSVLVRRPQARAAAEADGLPWAGTVAAAVRDADAVFVVVLTDEQVRSVCLGPDGAIAAMKPGATLIQHTTSDPVTAELLTAAGAGRGIRVVARSAGADLGIIGTVLSSDVVGEKVLHRASAPGRAS